MNKYKYFKAVFLWLIVFGGIMHGCKKWDDHNRVTEEAAGMNLLQRIEADPELSRFAELLASSGYADTVASSKRYTVYAPTNQALTALPPNITQDASLLKRFVAGHILSSAYTTTQIEGTIRAAALSGKYHDLTNTSIDNIAISRQNLLAKNGLLQVIGEALPLLENTAAFVASDARMPALQRAVLSGVLDSLFKRRVFDLTNESKNYTLFVVSDAAWQAEVEKYKPYFNVPGNEDSSRLVASWNVAKDWVVDTLYPTVASLPDTITSKFGVKTAIPKANIVEVVKTSNGVVYIMESLETLPRHKFRDIIIEAENYNGASHNRLGNTFIRDKRDSTTGGIFRDVLVYNHGVAMFNLRYRLTEIPSIKYRAYWMALNDNINGMTSTFNQKIGVDSFNSPTPVYATVALNRYAEQFAGEFTLTQYRPTFNLYLTAANSTSANVNAIVCNYIRLEPVF
ncbi:fasciclin domain-containing protein [Niabella insulamsoli]|uniref:fasciclin domain-containing protein n=1 Tax=Niabella insulamsoli TaxID=3144874 RepID=UPI0031FDC99A